ncbi:Testisin [Tieghemiomyces parasiticus]|uniref:Testisin n=1 Tax=Tieghemiomyces parasiticus TaxID=78921 RepID=A0A9W8DV07_9FUNG|nr:Testisin [Tieghemiomyces parasiticus]
MTNDIGLIQLTAPLIFSNTVMAIKLDSGRISVGDALTAQGWGKLANNDTYGSAVLKEVQLSTLSHATCAEGYKYLEPAKGDQVCTGLQEGKDTCRGDSGGPLVRVFGFAHAALIGITSVDTDRTGATPVCGAANVISVFTRAAYFIPWITTVTSIEPGELLYTSSRNSSASSSPSPMTRSSMTESTYGTASTVSGEPGVGDSAASRAEPRWLSEGIMVLVLVYIAQRT